MAAKRQSLRQKPQTKRVSAASIRAGRARAAKKRVSAKPAATEPTASALAAFAHEVRTPLTGILAISDLLAASDLGPRERQWVETIKAGAEHLASVATLFVDSAKGSRKGKLALQREPFDLARLIRSAGDSLVGRAASKDLKPDVKLSPDIPALVVGDAVRLRAALENLVDNAVKFTERGSVALTASAFPAESGRIAVSISVSDSGIGLKLAEIKRLFRPFSQANLGIAARFGGAGLGLASVRQIARAMGGEVDVAARKGGGSMFTMTVLLDQPPKNSAAPSIALQPLKILCVEDNPYGRVVFKAVLSELGHTTSFIEGGENADAAIAQGQFDAVLMDMVLPGIDGIAAIRKIRALPEPKGNVPIIGVSGREQDRAAALAAGADAFAIKPVSPRELADLLAQATHRQRSRLRPGSSGADAAP